MYIAIDGNEANNKTKVGSGYFAHRLLCALEKYDKKNKYIIYLKDLPQSDLPPARTNWQYKVVSPKKFWTRLALPISIYSSLPYPDLFFSPSHYSPPFLPCKKIVSILDLGYLDTPDQFTKKDFYQLKNWTESSINTSRHFLCISQYTRDDLVTKYKISPDRTSVIYPVITKPKHIDSKLFQKYISPGETYALSVGTLKPSKNIPYLLTAFSQYKKSSGKSIQKLIIGGKKGWLFEDIFSTVKKLHLEQDVIFTDYLSDAEKWSLLQNAQVLIIPSLFEGFGIPAVEAMLVQTPVIGSDRGSLNEIIKNRGEIVALDNPSNLKDLLLHFDKQKSQKKYSKSWSEISKLCSEEYITDQVITMFENTKKV